jgi:hypothetical protein
MNKIVLSIIIISFFSCTKDKYKLEDLEGVKQLAWVKNFGGSGNDSPRAIIQTLDGGFAVLGFSDSIDDDLVNKTLSVNDYWLLKLNADGNIEWQRTYGGSKDDRGQQVIQTSDGGFAIAGYAMSDDGDASNNEGFHDNWILRLDSAGEILWEKSFGFSGHDHSYDLVETPDGGIFFTGFLDVTSSNGEGSTNKSSGLTRHGVGEFWGTKLDTSGNIEWRKFFGGTNNDRSFGVINANDGGYILAGASESDDFDISNPKGSYDFWVVKVDKNGNLEWERSFGGTGIDQGQDITKTADGNYVVVGNTFSADTQVTKNNGASDIWFIKISDSGELIWERTYGGSGFDAAHSVNLTSNGGFIISGNSKSSDKDASENQGENDFWVLTTDTNGNIVNEFSLGGTGLDFAYDAIQANDGSIMLVGETASDNFPKINHKGAVDLIVAKMN